MGEVLFPGQEKALLNMLSERNNQDNLTVLITKPGPPGQGHSTFHEALDLTYGVIHLPPDACCMVTTVRRHVERSIHALKHPALYVIQEANYFNKACIENFYHRGFRGSLWITSYAHHDDVAGWRPTLYGRPSAKYGPVMRELLYAYILALGKYVDHDYGPNIEIEALTNNALRRLSQGVTESIMDDILSYRAMRARSYREILRSP